MALNSNECDGEQNWYALFRRTTPENIEDVRTNMVWAWCNRQVAEEENDLYVEWDRQSGSNADNWHRVSFPRSDSEIREVPLPGGKKGELILDFHYVVEDYMIATENNSISKF
tara:strand:+ start:225 stop:563 length:339 start_codon:yes stop_codon:yes gene_type:complete